MQFPIFIGLRRSHFLDLAVLVVALVASAAALGFLGAKLIQFSLLLTILVLALLAWRNLRPCFGQIRLERTGHILAAKVGETAFSRVELEPLSIVHPWLTVIRLRAESGRTYALIITVDSLSSSDFRRLKVFLRWQADVSEPGDDA